ncbi:hypothetical protein [Stenotrophomonas maltophilia]|uniref:hypothetical protein n=1 Tax=Stenotrophomonas maltophilia TaxID=40324 RepID=UPI00209B3E05|nr:hypothetical protein [Stenotrophomonas maltophilia]MCO7473058.1 hypothetical protein [Stenotrophomonas maltophilia]
MRRAPLKTKSFNISCEELEGARDCAKEQGISLNKFLRLAVVEKTRGVVQGLEATDTLNEIRAQVKDWRAEQVQSQDLLLADVRAEFALAAQANEDLVMKTLQAFSQFLAPSEPSEESPRKSRPEAATVRSKPAPADWQRYASGS